jgi:NAD(P)H-dependent FMN reductase
MSIDASSLELRSALRPVRLLAFGASLRTGSLNERLISLAVAVAQQQGATVTRATLRDFDCPSYSGDVDKAGKMPEGAVRLRDRLLECDAFLIASPEYNASMPGTLKNVIDWVSRFKPQPFNGRQSLLLSASPSMSGGNRGLWALRIPLEHLGARVYPDMFSLAQAHEALGPDGRISNGVLQARFERTIECFLNLVESSIHYPALKKQWVEYLGEQPNPETNREEHAPIEAA